MHDVPPVSAVVTATAETGWLSMSRKLVIQKQMELLQFVAAIVTTRASRMEHAMLTLQHPDGIGMDEALP